MQAMGMQDTEEEAGTVSLPRDCSSTFYMPSWHSIMYHTHFLMPYLGLHGFNHGHEGSLWTQEL